MSDYDNLLVLCTKMAAAVKAAGGMVRHGEQAEWGILPEQQESDGEPEQQGSDGEPEQPWELLDCDGERWAEGTAADILKAGPRLIKYAARCAAESGAEV